MRRAQLTAAAAILALGSALGAASCASSGELIVAIQTDMSLPKDIDSIQVQASVLGVVKYQNEFTRLGTELALVKLPATLALLGPEDPGTPVKILVTGRKGSVLRVRREVVTTVPEERVATLHVKLESLCVGFDTEDRDGVITSPCGEGETCIAGSCASSAAIPDDLPDFNESDVFGGGTGHGDGKCFDVTKCFIGAQPLTRSAESECTYLPPKGLTSFNVGLLTEITGICGAASCLVALDTKGASGWSTTEAGLIKVPDAVCNPVGQTVTLGVVAAPTTAECPLKGIELPNCGTWSSTGSPPDEPPEPIPLPVALAQANPGSLTVTDSDVFWTNRGVTIDGKLTGASVNRASADGGAIGQLDVAPGAPRGVAVGSLVVLYTVAGSKPDEVRRIDAVDFVNKGSGITPIDASTAMPQPPQPIDSPDAIAVSLGSAKDAFFWTEFGPGLVRGVSIDKTTGKAESIFQVADSQSRPVSIVASQKAVCWANEGTLGMADGSVNCVNFSDTGTTLTRDMQNTPRALALGPDGETIAWATFASPGQVFLANALEDPKSPISTPAKEVATGMYVKYPNGVALDNQFVYWTNIDDGTVWKRDIKLANDPVKIADGQNRPSAIGVSADAIYWINEGLPTEATGSVIRLAKKK